MDAQQLQLLMVIHDLADAVQRDVGRYCHVDADHHTSGVLGVRVSIIDSDPGEPPEFVIWDTSRHGITITDVRDKMAEWIANNRRDAA